MQQLVVVVRSKTGQQRVAQAVVVVLARAQRQVAPRALLSTQKPSSCRCGAQWGFVWGGGGGMCFGCCWRQTHLVCVDASIKMC